VLRERAPGRDAGVEDEAISRPSGAVPSLKVFVMLEQNSRGSTTTWFDVFDRVLGKGIVVEAWALGVPLGCPIGMAAGDTRIIVHHGSPPLHRGQPLIDTDP
jgi:hypothetical protein